MYGNAMRLRTATKNDTGTVREIPRAGVRILWVNDFYDVPLQGVAEVEDVRCLFEIIDPDADEVYSYWLIAFSPEQLREEEVWHELFCRKVGTHFDYTGRPASSAEEVCPDEFYGPYNLRTQPNYTFNEIIGWFKL